MQIWPAIDIRAGKCVRLIQGDYQRETVYDADPAEVARRFAAEGARYLHVVDLDGARVGERSNEPTIRSIVESVPGLTVQLGGGIRDEASIERYLGIGIQRLVVGTQALKAPDWLIAITARYPHRLVVGLDARDGRVASEGWLAVHDRSVFDVARDVRELPIAGVVFTDISKDGMMSGPNFQAMSEMKSVLGSVPLICSGGVTTREDIVQLKELQIAGCILGRTLYEGKLQLKEALAAAGCEPAKARDVDQLTDSTNG